jgi:thioesterase domain-containing protein
MVVINKIYSWCKKNWKALGVALGGLIAFLVGSKRQKDKNEDNVILLDQAMREAAFVEKAQREERKKIIKAEIKYQIAMQELESKYDDDTSKLEREKDHIYRQILDRAKNDPDKLDRLLEEMGINEVKKS